MYYLTKFDDVLKNDFSVIPRLTSERLWKPIHDIITYFTSVCPFESGKCGKGIKKLQKFEHLKNEKSFFIFIKTFFYSF